MSPVILKLIRDIFEGANGLLDWIFKILELFAFNIEDTMGLKWFESVSMTVMWVAVSLITLKFLSKGFDVYICGTDGDPDRDPVDFLLSYVRALAVAVNFHIIYGWLTQGFVELTQLLMKSITVSGVDMLASSQAFFSLLSIIPSQALSQIGIVFPIVELVYLILFIVLFIKYAVQGFEILILRVGFPIACMGLVDSDKGVFAPYIRKFYQAMLVVLIQTVLIKVSLILLVSGAATLQIQDVIWSVVTIVVAMQTPRILQEFMFIRGGGSGGVSTIANLAYTARQIISKGAGGAAGGAGGAGGASGAGGVPPPPPV